MTQIPQLQTGLAAGISLPWSSVEAFSFGCKEFVWSRHPTVSMALTSVFDTTPPDEGGRLNCVWQHTPGFSSPPRISRSCPHCLRLWLDRGTIVGRYGLGKGGPPRPLLDRCCPLAALLGAGLGAPSALLSSAAYLLKLFNRRV